MAPDRTGDLDQLARQLHDARASRSSEESRELRGRLLATLLPRLYEARNVVQELTELMWECVIPVVRSSMRRTLGNLPADDREDVEANIRASLLKLLSDRDIPTEPFIAYVIKISASRCVDHLRSLYPGWSAVKRKIQLLINEDPRHFGFIPWPDASSKYCALSGYMNSSSEIAMGVLLQLVNDYARAQKLLDAAIEDLENEERDLAPVDLSQSKHRNLLLPFLVRAIFKEIDGPVLLNPLTNLVADLLGLRVLPPVSSRRPGPETDEDWFERGTAPDSPLAEFDPAEAAEQMLYYWYHENWPILQSCSPLQYASFLLNDGTDDCGIRRGFHDIYGLSFDALAEPMERPGAQLAALWNSLPLPSSVIAFFLGGMTSGNTVNVARWRVRRRLGLP